MRSPKSSKASSKHFKQQMSPSKSQSVSGSPKSTFQSFKKSLQLSQPKATTKKVDQHPTNQLRRHSLLSSYDSPSARRRSFLSSSMISNENFVVYDLGRYSYSYTNTSCKIHGYNNRDYDDEEGQDIDEDDEAFNGINQDRCTCSVSDVPRFSVTLNESQGFNWNQDLFANRYQQESGLMWSNDTIDGEDNGKYTLPKNGLYSYSLSHEEGIINKIDVIDINLDEDDTSLPLGNG